MGDRDRSRDRTRRDKSKNDGGRDRSQDRDRKSMKSSNCRVYVSNIPYECRWQDLKDTFRNEIGDVQFVELFVDENDKAKGTGIVEFSDPKSVQKCLDVMQKFEIRTRKLVVKDDSGNMRDKHGRLVAGGNRRMRDDRREDRFGSSMSLSNNLDNKWGNTYNLSPSFLESLNINVPLCNKVFVANLAYNVDKKKLKEVFRLAGKVQRVDLQLDKDGNSRGFAVIEFDHPVEAVQAISMFHNQTLYDRVMTVRMDRIQDSLKLPEGLKGIGMGLGLNGEPLRDVARNLPQNNPGPAQDTNGILGAVPSLTNYQSQALQVANALSSLGNSGIGGLASNSSINQAASLTNLLGSRLGGDSGLGTNSQIPSLTAATSQFGTASNLPFSRTDTNNYNSSQDLFNSRPTSNFSNYDNQKLNFGNRDSFSKNTGGASISSKNKVLITNLPATASFKMLVEKFNEFGDVQHVEEKGTGNMLIVYGSDWQAETAIKNLDRARIDGRTIEARFYY